MGRRGGHFATILGSLSIQRTWCIKIIIPLEGNVRTIFSDSVISASTSLCPTRVSSTCRRKKETGEVGKTFALLKKAYGTI
jgi:hypothetical protein